MKVNLIKSWNNNEIPKVTKGLWGDKLTNENIKVKIINKDCEVLVGEKTSGSLSDKQVINYFMQFVGYPKYRKYIIDTLRKLDNMRTVT